MFAFTLWASTETPGGDLKELTKPGEVDVHVYLYCPI